MTESERMKIIFNLVECVKMMDKYDALEAKGGCENISKNIKWLETIIDMKFGDDGDLPLFNMPDDDLLFVNTLATELIPEMIKLMESANIIDDIIQNLTDTTSLDIDI